MASLYKELEHVEHSSALVAWLIEAVSAAKFAKGLTAETIVYLGFIEVTTK